MSSKRIKPRPTTEPRAGSPRDPGDEIEIFDLVELHAICFPNGRTFGIVLGRESVGGGLVLYLVRNNARLDELVRVRREEIHQAWADAGPAGVLERSLLRGIGA
jgi:hypothetical protein